jgi:Tol biopolymer transport system component/predicted Ser/Thr protein kinase
MALSAGEKLGPYEILAPIGKGGMGEVYRAHDARTGRDVAIKVSAEQFNERFDREVRAVAALNHPNICTLFDVGPNYLVMEFIEGECPQGPLPPEEALQIARQIAAALEEAHGKGIVHRDLKPANIKVKPDGAVKVLDFGLAKIADAPEGVSENSPTLSMAATQAGMILGTAAYMSPEQARGKRVDKRADIWAFGVVLYEILTGDRLFGGETIADTLIDVATKQPDWDRVPPSLLPLLRRCLEKDPTKRLRDIGDLDLLLAAALPAPAVADAVPPPPPGKGKWIAWGVAALATVLAASLAFLHFREQPPERQILQYVLAAPEKAKNIQNFALSPDGRFLVMRAQGETGAQLWVRAMDSLQAQPLAGTENAAYPFWSPDNRYIAFAAGGKLKKISVNGGPAQPLCDAPGLRGGAWSSEGVILLGSSNGGLLRVPVAGGVPVPATKTEPGSHRSPVFLPDGHHFLYTAINGKDNGVFLGSLGSGESHRIAQDVSMPEYFNGHVLFVRDGTLMAQPVDPKTWQPKGDLFPVAPEPVARGPNLPDYLYSVSNNGVLIYKTGGEAAARQLRWFDRSGKEGELVGGAAPIGQFSLAPDGKRVATSRQNGGQGHVDIWVTDPEHHTESRITFDASNNQFPIWSPDGARIAFSSDRRGGVFNLYQRAANGTGQDEPLLESKLINAPWDWSRDGQFLFFVNVDPKTYDDIFALPMTGAGKKPIPVVHSNFQDRGAQISPDGRWLAYTTNESGGRYDVYVVPFAPDTATAPAGKWQISTAGGTQPRWRADGKEIFYMTPDRKLMAAEVKASGPNFDHSAPQVLFDSHADDLAANPTMWSYAVSADGKRFLISVTPGAAAEAPPLTVVVNWLAAVKK